MLNVWPANWEATKLGPNSMSFGSPLTLISPEVAVLMGPTGWLVESNSEKFPEPSITPPVYVSDAGLTESGTRYVCTTVPLPTVLPEQKAKDWPDVGDRLRLNCWFEPSEVPAARAVPETWTVVVPIVDALTVDDS